MPIYEYTCTACEKRFEELVRSEDEAVTCPGCGGRQLRREPSAFAVSSRETTKDAAPKAWEGCPPEGCPPCRGMM